MLTLVGLSLNLAGFLFKSVQNSVGGSHVSSPGYRQNTRRGAANWTANNLGLNCGYGHTERLVLDVPHDVPLEKGFFGFPACQAPPPVERQGGANQTAKIIFLTLLTFAYSSLIIEARINSIIVPLTYCWQAKMSLDFTDRHTHTALNWTSQTEHTLSLERGVRHYYPIRSIALKSHYKAKVLDRGVK